MKKYFFLAILAGASVFVSAQTFKLSGHVRSGISTAFDGAKGEDRYHHVRQNDGRGSGIYPNPQGRRAVARRNDGRRIIRQIQTA